MADKVRRLVEDFGRRMQLLHVLSLECAHAHRRRGGAATLWISQSFRPNESSKTGPIFWSNANERLARMVKAACTAFVVASHRICMNWARTPKRPKTVSHLGHKLIRPGANLRRLATTSECTLEYGRSAVFQSTILFGFVAETHRPPAFRPGLSHNRRVSPVRA